MPRYYEDDDDHDDDLDIGRFPRRRRHRREREDEGPKPQSGLGITSLLLSICCGVGVFFLIVVAAVVEGNRIGPANDKDPMAIALGIGILACCGFSVIGVVLGVVGSMQPDRAALCGILGSVFNLLILSGTAGLICLGLALGG